jgi:hypothetical protein
LAKLNCWEVKQCGREVGGPKQKELGVCPAAVNFTNHGKNGGKSAGRFCWRVAGTLCGGRVQGSVASKMANCTSCDFFGKVSSEEGAAFQN